MKTNPRRTVLSLALLALTWSAATPRAVAQIDLYWSDGGVTWQTTNRWGTANDGVNNATWADGNNAFFSSPSATGSVSVNTTYVANNLTITRAAQVFTMAGTTAGVTVNGTYSDVAGFSVNNSNVSPRTFTLTLLNDATAHVSLTNDATRTLNFVKAGAGAMTLTSTTNTLVGTTTVSAGSLILNGNITTSSGVTVNTGATLGGNGDGTTTGRFSNATLAGGSGTGGVLSLGNGTLGNQGLLTGTSLTWNGVTTTPFSQMVFDLSTVDSTSDRLNLSGALDKGTGDIFQFDFRGFNATAASTYNLINFGSSDFSVGDFTAANISYDSGLSGSFELTGSSLNFVVIPEPSTLLIFGAGCAVLLCLRRRTAAGRPLDA